MEILMAGDFIELNECELDCVDGGANAVQAVGGTIGAAVVCWAPALLLAGVAPIAVAGLAIAGVGAFINMATSN